MKLTFALYMHTCIHECITHDLIILKSLNITNQKEQGVLSWHEHDLKYYQDN